MKLSHLKRAVLRLGDKSNPRSGCPGQVTCSLCQLQCRGGAQARGLPGLSQAHPLLQSETDLQEKDLNMNLPFVLFTKRALCFWVRLCLGISETGVHAVMHRAHSFSLRHTLASAALAAHQAGGYF